MATCYKTGHRFLTWRYHLNKPKFMLPWGGHRVSWGWISILALPRQTLSKLLSLH